MTPKDFHKLTADHDQGKEETIQAVAGLGKVTIGILCEGIGFRLQLASAASQMGEVIILKCALVTLNDVALRLMDPENNSEGEKKPE